MPTIPLGHLPVTAQDEFGNVIPNASVEIRTETGLTLTTIYSDRNGINTKTNPMTADAFGFVDCYVPAGFYQIKCVGRGIVSTLRDVEVGGTAIALQQNLSTIRALSATLPLKGYNGLSVDFARNFAIAYDEDDTAKQLLGDAEEFFTHSRASVAYHNNEEGVLTQVAADVIRYEYDPYTFRPIGPIFERTGKNVIDDSEEMNDWTQSNVTVSANSLTAPDGTLTGDKVIESGGGSLTHSVISQNFTPLANTPYSFSGYFYPGERTKVSLQVGAAFNGAAIRVLFDLVALTASVTLGTAYNLKMKRRRDGWIRCEFGSTSGATPTAANLRFYTVDAASSVTYAGDGVSGFYAWGGMIGEDEASASSYIKTVTAPSTRSPDLVTLDPAKIPFRENVGVTVAISGRVMEVPKVATSYLAVFFDGAINDDAIQIVVKTTGQLAFRQYKAGVLRANIDVGAVVIGEDFNAVFSIIIGNASARSSITDLTTTTGGASLANAVPTTWRIALGGKGANMTLEQLTIMARPMIDREMKAFTDLV